MRVQSAFFLLSRTQKYQRMTMIHSMMRYNFPFNFLQVFGIETSLIQTHRFDRDRWFATLGLA